MSRGDYVEVRVDLGGGASQEYRIGARAAGRHVKVTRDREGIHVDEIDRAGQKVRGALFMVDRVIACVEHPMDEGQTRSGRRLPAGLQTHMELEGAVQGNGRASG